ncbi:hypothetical protein [Neisseria meningitidis]|uniref:hypothetical protein n=1 Tax=Neisseria meningitidis TaxID=487 RepID=UPI000A3C71D2|nr:hypothetical protein [Neisseria meningitidis]
MKTNDKLNRQIDVLQKQSAAIHNEAYIEMNTLLYRHREVVSVHNRKADYAEKGKERIALFPRGLNGITKLPAAVLLPERPDCFDMKAVQRERFSKVLKHQVNRFRTICTVCGFVALF